MTFYSNLFKSICRERRTILALAHRDILLRYSGTVFRGLWELANPALTLVVFWFVFSFAFKAKGPSDTPFIIYFVTGYLPWIFFSECLSRGAESVVAHSFLIKKTVFNSEILPFVYIASGAVKHALLMAIATFILILNDVVITWWWLQLPYFFLTLCIVLIGLQWLLSALNAFNRDLGQGVGIMLNVWFWITPVVWLPDVVPPHYRWLILANPVAYVIDGYRGSLLFQQPFFINWQQGLYVWCTSIIIAIFGVKLFLKLKPHFGDVL